MFFILSKVLRFLIEPFMWVVILMLASWVIKKSHLKKRLRIASLVIVILFTNPFLYRSLVQAWQPEPININPEKKYSLGILLSGMADHDKFGHGYFGDNADRFITTANLYHRGIIQKILVTGGSGSLRQDEPAEAFFLREQLLLNGVKDSAILIESRARNTYENGVFSKKIIDSMHTRAPFVLITSALHMPRSVRVFSKLGIDVVPYPCDYKVIEKNRGLGDFIIPNIKVMNDWSYFIKEIIGYWTYKFTGKA